jgi:hypothetical protein
MSFDPIAIGCRIKDHFQLFNRQLIILNSNYFEMEVHTHTHTPRKKWTHYFWEFFMLFLAVTLGFLVENQREHYIEHRQEKQYMKLMMEDLITDTIQLQKSLTEIEHSLSNIDSTILHLVTRNVAKQTTTDAYRFSSVALKRIPVVFTDWTLT